MTAQILLGCSGWDYPEWVGRFYPRRRTVDRLAYYAQVFPIVEVNTSFYRTPPARFVAQWAKRTPDGFRFTAKIPQEVTHDRRLVDVAAPLREHQDAFAPLVDAGKLAGTLVQLPPSLAFDERVVRAFYELLPRDAPIAVEFREPSWLAPESYDLLTEFGLGTTVVDEPLLPVALRQTTSQAYVRWHGHGAPVWYDYTYAREELRPWTERLAEIGSGASTILGFFNNHFRGDATVNALQLRELLGLDAPVWSARLGRGSLDDPSLLGESAVPHPDP